jgi:hypothetical protein
VNPVAAAFAQRPTDFIASMKFIRTFASLALAVLAATQAHATDPAAVMALAGNLVATPNPVRFSAYGDITQFQTVQVVNSGAGFASNMSMTLTHQGTSRLSQMAINGDTCNGATLAPNGTCVIHLAWDESCPKAQNDTWFLTITSTTAPTLTVPIYAQSKGGSCE